MHSGTVPETFRNTNVDNQGTNEDDSMSDPHPEAALFRSQTTQNSGQEVGPHSAQNRTLPSLLNCQSIWIYRFTLSGDKGGGCALDCNNCHVYVPKTNGPF